MELEIKIAARIHTPGGFQRWTGCCGPETVTSARQLLVLVLECRQRVLKRVAAMPGCWLGSIHVQRDGIGWFGVGEDEDPDYRDERIDRLWREQEKQSGQEPCN